MALDQITSQSIADNAISAGDLADGSITAAKLSSTAIADKLGYTPVSPTQLTTEVNNLVNAAPGALNTLGELATALGNDASFATTVTNALATKAVPTDITPTNVSDKDNTSTGYFDLPAGTTAQRPGSPQGGNIRFNTTTSGIEFYDGTAWSKLSIVADGSTAAKAAISAAAIKQINGTTTDGNYWIMVNGSPKQVFCDMSGTYTGDASGWMLYQSFGTNSLGNGGYAIQNTSLYSSNIFNNGWTSNIDSSSDSSDNYWAWTGGPPTGYITLNSWSASTPAVSKIMVKWGKPHDASGTYVELHINGSLVQSNSTPYTTQTYRNTFNASGSNIVRLYEYGATIFNIYYIFVQ